MPKQFVRKPLGPQPGSAKSAALALTLLHTSPVHVARFDALRDRIAPHQALRHVVRADWLDRARAKGIGADLIAEMAAECQGVTLCTCTTLGPAAEKLGALRIDRPMMHKASQLSGPLVLAYCLHSTAQSSLDLLTEALAARQTQVHSLDLTRAWSKFEAGDVDGYGAEIAAGLCAYMDSHPDTGAIILAQASMDVALPFLDRIGIPILSPADSALRAAISRLALRG